MFGGIDQHFDYRLQVMNLRAARQQVLASNIANADTPGYKARDIDFRAALARIQAGDGALGRVELTRTSARHLESRGTAPGGAPLLFRSALQPSIDGNTVDMNVEIAQFAENAVRMQADIAFMQSRISGLQRAIQGQ